MENQVSDMPNPTEVVPAKTTETKANDRMDTTSIKGYAWPLMPFAA
jgi:hypothetical protein